MKTKEERRQEQIRDAEVYARFNDRAADNEINKPAQYKKGDLATVHGWASFGCEILASFHNSNGDPLYVVFVPFRNEKWYDVKESQLS